MRICFWGAVCCADTVCRGHPDHMRGVGMRPAEQGTARGKSKVAASPVMGKGLALHEVWLCQTISAGRACWPGLGDTAFPMVWGVEVFDNERPLLRPPSLQRWSLAG